MKYDNKYENTIGARQVSRYGNILERLKKKLWNYQLRRDSISSIGAKKVKLKPSQKPKKKKKLSFADVMHEPFPKI